MASGDRCVGTSSRTSEVGVIHYERLHAVDLGASPGGCLKTSHGW